MLAWPKLFRVEHFPWLMFRLVFHVEHFDFKASCQKRDVRREVQFQDVFRRHGTAYDPIELFLNCFCPNRQNSNIEKVSRGFP